MKNIYVDRRKLQTGDVFCSTALDPAGAAIRFWTWGIQNIVNMDCGSHTGLIVHEDNTWNVYEMDSTRKKSRYRFGNSVIDPDQHAELDKPMQDLYKPIEVSTGLMKRNIEEYECGKFDKHICFIGRHRVFSDPSKQDAFKIIVHNAYNNGIPYDWKAIWGFISGEKDANDGKEICSRFVWHVFDDLKIDMPKKWIDQISPKDWQTWPELQNIDFKVKF